MLFGFQNYSRYFLNLDRKLLTLEYKGSSIWNRTGQIVSFKQGVTPRRSRGGRIQAILPQNLFFYTQTPCHISEIHIDTFDQNTPDRY